MLVYSVVIVDVTSRSSTITLLQTRESSSFIPTPHRETPVSSSLHVLSASRCSKLQFLNSVCFRLFRKLFSSKDTLLNPNVGTVRTKLCEP